MRPAVTEPGHHRSQSSERRRLLPLAVAAVAIAVAAAAVAIPRAEAGGKPALRPPSLLWKSYPLVEHARASADRNATSTKVASAAGTAQSHGVDHMLLMTALLATFLAAGTVVFLRRPAGVRAGGSLRGRSPSRSRSRSRTPKPVRRPEPRRLRPVPPEPPPLDELPPEDVAEPAPTAEYGAGTHTQDDVQRALDDLLEALQPLSPDEEAPSRTPELELRELIVRKYAAPASARPSIDREIDTALERIEERRAAEARARAARRTSLARCEIRLWRGFVKSQFYVTLAESDEAFALSEPFRSRDADGRTAQAERALSGLLAELAQAGWAVVADGSAWYEHTLELRPADSGAEPEEALAAEDAPPTVVYRTVPKRDGVDDGRS